MFFKLFLSRSNDLPIIKTLTNENQISYAQVAVKSGSMVLNAQEYLEYQGVNVMLAHDFYPEGHQGGVGIIQNGIRVATNGDIRLEPTPGQWQPIPKVGKRMVDVKKEQI